MIILIFTFVLHSQETETLCDILQRRYAKYGDDSGNKVLSSVKNVQSILITYRVKDKQEENISRNEDV
jgi:hypothetical protein